MQVIYILECVTVQWCVKMSVDHLITDPFSSVAAAFVLSDTGSTDSKCHGSAHTWCTQPITLCTCMSWSSFFFVTVYIFSPPSDLLALHKSVCPMEVVGAVFLPMKVGNETKSHHHHIVKSRLYFMDRKQVCHDVKWYHWGKRIFFSLGSLLSQMGRWEWWRETTTYTPSWGYIWESLHRNLWW